MIIFGDLLRGVSYGPSPMGNLPAFMTIASPNTMLFLMILGFAITGFIARVTVRRTRDAGWPKIPAYLMIVPLAGIFIFLGLLFKNAKK